ncbi:flagellar hook-associated protein FlgK [Noviherbaspirillum massiliense]|uniref:flagellar hook-associated protein FlgK n=1 Tax=Noviherbaspirillum massiliense TaxID=1465823 RepID=UPI0002F23A62|nr:flagellar hook-associated protein FlgK [Noviherbaspirillum massiliense]
MASSILSIGQSALAAAQTGLATTGHNIANANTPGYSRQVVIQGPANAQYAGYGFVGKGTEVVAVKRVYNEFLNNQVLSAQTSKNALDSYYSQIKQIDNMLADTSSGISSSMQEFFNSIQGLTTNPNASGSRQLALSNASALAARFQAMSGRLSEMREAVNGEISSSVSTINNYASQIAKLNDSIEKAQSAGGIDNAPNDLLDQRDYLVSELSKEVKVSVVKQGNSYNVFIGNGQPVVMGAKNYELAAVPSDTDPTRLEVAYRSNGTTTVLPESNLTGGRLSGLFDFRSKTLDQAQNALGRVALGLAMTFNAQHAQGYDQNGVAGSAFFTAAVPLVHASSTNDKTAAAMVGASISNPSALTTSDYMLEAVGTGAYRITRVSDGTVTNFSGFPVTVDGVDFNLTSGTPALGDRFLVRPTANGASQFGLAISDTTKIAVAGSTPADPKDNDNALLLAKLQTSKVLGGDTFQGAYGQLVSQIGSKTHELEVTSAAEAKLLESAVAAQQNESGVNLDEEATNLLRYQQAYQAAGKVMQTASQLFDVLLSIGN